MGIAEWGQGKLDIFLPLASSSLVTVIAVTDRRNHAA